MMIKLQSIDDFLNDIKPYSKNIKLHKIQYDRFKILFDRLPKFSKKSQGNLYISPRYIGDIPFIKSDNIEGDNFDYEKINYALSHIFYRFYINVIRNTNFLSIDALIYQAEQCLSTLIPEMEVHNLTKITLLDGDGGVFKQCFITEASRYYQMPCLIKGRPAFCNIDCCITPTGVRFYANKNWNKSCKFFLENEILQMR